MLKFLDKKLLKMKKSLPIAFRKADTTKLPYPDAVFDIAIVVHLFYFIQQWKEAVDEILRLLKQDSSLVLMHTGTGTEIPFINQRYRELCAEQGCPIKDVGVKSTSEVVDYLTNLGFNTEWIRDRWQWDQRIRLSKALDYMSSRTYSFTTFAPKKVHSIVMGKLESELHRQYGTLSTEVKIPNQIYFVFASRAL